jgi:hypothetical protein
LKETKNDAPKIPAGSSMDQKTNEDFNKKKPDPADPNQQKGQRKTPGPNFDSDGAQPTMPGYPGKRDEQQKPPNKSEGSE